MWETEVSSLWIGKRGCEYSWWLLILYSTVSVCLLFEQKDLEHPILWEPSTVVISVLSCQLKSSPNWFSCTLVSIHFQLTLERWQVKYCSSLKLFHDFLCQWEQEEPTAFRVAKCWAMSGGVLFCPPHHLTLNALLVSHTRCILRLWHRWCPGLGHCLLSLSLLLQVFIHESYSQIPTNMPANFLIKRVAKLLLSLPFPAPGFISLYSSVADHVNISNLLVHPHLLRSSKVDGSSLVVSRCRRETHPLS